VSRFGFETRNAQLAAFGLNGVTFATGSFADFAVGKVPEQRDFVIGPDAAARRPDANAKLLTPSYDGFEASIKSPAQALIGHGAKQFIFDWLPVSMSVLAQRLDAQSKPFGSHQRKAAAEAPSSNPIGHPAEDFYFRGGPWFEFYG